MDISWSDIWSNDSQRWPDTNLVRMLRGKWKRCDLKKEKYSDSCILDMGCGDGSNFPLYFQCGFKGVYGVEISEEIVDLCNKKYSSCNQMGGVKLGTNDAIPFESNMFDYVVSWNEIYYMGTPNHFFNIDDYIREFARVIKPNGVFIFSIPMYDNGIYRNSQNLGDGYAVIHNDRHGVRDGIVMKRFLDENDIRKCLEAHFYGMEFSSLIMDFFDDDNEIRHYLGFCYRKEE